MDHRKNGGFSIFGLSLAGKTKKLYNALEPIFYIFVHNERGKGHNKEIM